MHDDVLSYINLNTEHYNIRNRIAINKQKLYHAIRKSQGNPDSFSDEENTIKAVVLSVLMKHNAIPKYGLKFGNWSINPSMKKLITYNNAMSINTMRLLDDLRNRFQNSKPELVNDIVELSKHTELHDKYGMNSSYSYGFHYSGDEHEDNASELNIKLYKSVDSKRCNVVVSQGWSIFTAKLNIDFNNDKNNVEQEIKLNHNFFDKSNLTEDDIIVQVDSLIKRDIELEKLEIERLKRTEEILAVPLLLFGGV